MIVGETRRVYVLHPKIMVLLEMAMACMGRWPVLAGTARARLPAPRQWASWFQAVQLTYPLTALWCTPGPQAVLSAGVTSQTHSDSCTCVFAVNRTDVFFTTQCRTLGTWKVASQDQDFVIRKAGESVCIFNC